MKRYTSFIIVLMLFFTFNTAFAENIEEDRVLKIGLDEVIKRAVDTSEEFKIKGQEVNKTEGIYREVRAGMLPHVSAESTWTHNMDYPDSAASKYSDHELNSGVSASQG